MSAQRSEATMRAVTFSDFGGPDVLRVRDMPVPAPGRRQVRVRVHAAAANPTDTIFRAGLAYARSVGHPPPWIPGMDFAGTVDLPGPDSAWTAGTRVIGVAMPSGSRQGAYAEYVVVADESIAAIPEDIDPTRACTVPMNGLTALRALDGIEDLTGAPAVLGVTGSAGGVGGHFIEIAKLRGHRVIADAAESDLSTVQQFGADVVLPRGPEWPKQVVNAVGEVDGLLDAAVTGPSAAQAVKEGGVLAVVRPPGSFLGSLRVLNIQMTDYYRNHAKLAQVAQWVADGSLSLRVADVLPPEDAATAHRWLEAGGVRGRLVLRFEDAQVGGAGHTAPAMDRPSESVT